MCDTELTREIFSSKLLLTYKIMFYTTFANVSQSS
ncbi:hypothetical protein METHB2_70068 [Candidatus Methylobacter favarea]|uniref:Uncharacterized protein n=1 Tax=Candidatus Methylobacter favarea TaxID=2707345 RepID=A0A8S0WS36_9GAMM|nr:hypothetical protein METHB2_70068 [Candidatus Methylobacter favarea]